MESLCSMDVNEGNGGSTVVLSNVSVIGLFMIQMIRSPVR